MEKKELLVLHEYGSIYVASKVSTKTGKRVSSVTRARRMVKIVPTLHGKPYKSDAEKSVADSPIKVPFCLCLSTKAMGFLDNEA